jgi:glycosyltransferase involved in cell wall biosynthesis
VLRELLGALGTREQFDRVTVFVSPGLASSGMSLGRVKLVEMPGPHFSYRKRVTWYVSGLRKYAKNLGADAILCMNGMGLGTPGLPAFHFVQQSLPFSQEALKRFPLLTRIRFHFIRKLTLYSLARSHGVFVQAPWMKNIVDQELGGVVPVGLVMPGLGVVESRLHPAALGDPILLYVGSDSPHKNVRNLVQAFRILRESLTGAQLRLTLDEVPEYAGPGVTFLGHLSRNELFRQYEKASLLVMPSLVETVGLPLVEALSVGLPVVVSDRPYAHDVAGNCGRYFDPCSPGAMAEVALAVLADPGLNSSLRVDATRRYEELQTLPTYDALADLLLMSAGDNGEAAYP